MQERSEPGTLEAIVRDEWSPIVAALARRFGDLDVAEEAAGEAVVAAVESWGAPGAVPPPNPGGWLMTTATRKALDRLRRESRRGPKEQAAALLQATTEADPEPTGPVSDDRLRLIFTCCHPALAPEARLALTLRLVGGLTVPEIARALLSTEAAIGQRITRAKAKIRLARIPYRVPGPADLAERLDSVLGVLYLSFNEGYLTSSGTEPTRVDLSEEAIRLTRMLVALLPEPEVSGLLALMLLTDARRETRFVGGELVLLADQDRSRWSHTMIAEGHDLVRACLALDRPGRFQVLAAINAVHTWARTVAETDWSQIITLYDHLARLDPSPVVALNRAVAVAELDGPEVALALIEALSLTSYDAWHVARAEMLSRLGRTAAARDAYAEAIRLSTNEAGRRHLIRRRDLLDEQPTDRPDRR